MENSATLTKINHSLLDQKLTELEKARAWSPRVISKLEALINSQDPWDLYRVNPIRFANERGMDEAEAVDLFLHASKLGLFKMEWHLICPSCGDAVASFASLTGVHSHFSCKMCHLEADAQLDDYIEISFSVLPQVRDCLFHLPGNLSIEDFYFKYHFNNKARIPGGPTFVELMRSVGLGLGYLEPRASKTFEMKLQPGFLMGYDLIQDAGWFYKISGEPQQETQRLKIRLDEKGYSPPEGELRPGKLLLELENTLATRGSAMIGALPPDHFEHKTNLELPPFLTGNRLLNSQTFRNLYRSETIQGNEGIGIRDLTLLFTDLKGSTAMYERIGDLKAFSLVQQHFEHLGKAIQERHGAVVKTIGDAVMASFEKPADAVAAALQMLKEIEAFNQSQGSNEIILKIGIHRGTSIAVTLNERLDYFGQTVNIAARVQGVAGAEEICLTEELYTAPGVAEQLTGFTVSQELASLKGIKQSMRIHRVSGQLVPAKSKKKSKPKVKKKAPKKSKGKIKRKPKAPKRKK
jgi:class 3 adenylate cyclase